MRRNMMLLAAALAVPAFAHATYTEGFRADPWLAGRGRIRITKDIGETSISQMLMKCQSLFPLASNKQESKYIAADGEHRVVSVLNCNISLPYSTRSLKAGTVFPFSPAEPAGILTYTYPSGRADAPPEVYEQFHIPFTAADGELPDVPACTELAGQPYYLDCDELVMDIAPDGSRPQHSRLPERTEIESLLKNAGIVIE